MGIRRGPLMQGYRMVVGYEPLSRRTAVETIRTILGLRGFGDHTMNDCQGRWANEQGDIIVEPVITIDVYIHVGDRPDALEKAFLKVGEALCQECILVTKLGQGELLWI